MSSEIAETGNLIQIISQSRQNALKKVNEELIHMYWKVGEYLSMESVKASFGDAYIDSVVEEIQEAFPGIRGFNRRGLYRMKKFYETYRNDKFVSTLLSQISWSNHLAIMSKAKTEEERHFYITLCVKENYSARELSRQIDSGYYERYMLSKEKLLPEPIKGLKENPFLDSYVIEFLDLPSNFKEVDLRKGLIKNMKDFILEVGKDFTFIDEEYRVQVGGEDYKIDLLFFHRGLQCLVAFELKIGKFKPEYISKMDFYLEALDRQKKKENENPSVGMILCASKDDEVVEYAMSRTLSPMMVAEYQLQLPDKNVLQRKLQELINMPLLESGETPSLQ
ncbi:MAG: PDDEXK nuclease domain-containing protein [Butyrivibrio sp.]|nr:PDDEXK nuclease domain-containing protein [Muribaculum sp.]MCM1551690.1 PDDEXK nuclease domain-containing protein [Butyrivibrio sp.]